MHLAWTLCPKPTREFSFVHSHKMHGIWGDHKNHLKNGPTAMSEKYCDPHKCPVWSWTHYRVGHVGKVELRKLVAGMPANTPAKINGTDSYFVSSWCSPWHLDTPHRHKTEGKIYEQSCLMCESQAPSVGKKRSEKASTSKDQAFIQLPWIINWTSLVVVQRHMENEYPSHWNKEHCD